MSQKTKDLEYLDSFGIHNEKLGVSKKMYSIKTPTIINWLFGLWVLVVVVYFPFKYWACPFCFKIEKET